MGRYEHLMEIHPGVGSYSLEAEIRLLAKPSLPAGATIVAVRPTNQKCGHGLRVYAVEYDVDEEA